VPANLRSSMVEIEFRLENGPSSDWWISRLDFVTGVTLFCDAMCVSLTEELSHLDRIR
jgi:hypothetical protein